MNTIIAVSPIAILIWLMTKKRSMPSHLALPLVAILLYLLKILYFGSDLKLMNATLIDGLLTAWTPILVIWGAIFLFRTMENTGGMQVVRNWLNGITHNKVAQLMIIGWAFAFLIEGASGFGTPAALAAPLLVGLGFPALSVAMLTLIMNSVPVTFGAVGTPVWFGLGQLGLTDPQLIEIGAKSAIIHTVAALVIPIIALRFVVSFKEIRKNLLFVYLSILACVIPYVLLAQSSYDFPSIVGGFIGLIISVWIAKMGIGLEKTKKIRADKISLSAITKATFPLWGTMLLLLITRIPAIGLKALLTSSAHSLSLSLQPVADLLISSSLVLQLKNILGTGTNFSHALLYVPSIIPFFVVSFIAFLIYSSKGEVIKNSWSQSWQRMKKPIIALLAALVFVKLLLVDGDKALTLMIGRSLADLTGGYWQYFSAYLGGLGSFFSGSNTVSNLTFGGIQQGIATSLNLNLTTILAAQSVGGAMGNMVCINNIVAVCSVLGLMNVEGRIIKKTVIPMLIYGIIAGVVSIFLV
ncbi:L-lactate permease [Patescibacteria group bacterium]|nr:L-lactate permease [Patescibacteria group bacterium]MBU1016091.1 L-lactate permease [Patescibacteria group bacterium]MBU1684834.1 L-lactate permease [Patescibacteria group bacterium]MBU1938550.1 L-lactate permease [Patescibacteria group bacterium]